MMEWFGEITSWKQPSCNIPDKHGKFLFLLHQIDIKLHYTKDTSITIDNYPNFLHCTRIHQYNVYGQNIANFVHGTPDVFVELLAGYTKLSVYTSKLLLSSGRSAMIPSYVTTFFYKFTQMERLKLRTTLKGCYIVCCFGIQIEMSG